MMMLRMAMIGRVLMFLLFCPARAIVEKVPLQARDSALGLEESAGKSQVISAAAGRDERGGYYCATCDRQCHDSQSWLDHINSAYRRRVSVLFLIESEPHSLCSRYE